MLKEFNIKLMQKNTTPKSISPFLYRYQCNNDKQKNESKEVLVERQAADVSTAFGFLIFA